MNAEDAEKVQAVLESVRMSDISSIRRGRLVRPLILISILIAAIVGVAGLLRTPAQSVATMAGLQSSVGARVVVTGRAIRMKSGPAIQLEDGTRVICKSIDVKWPMGVEGRMVRATGRLEQDTDQYMDAPSVTYFAIRGTTWKCVDK